jgi:lantibiotic biosynthesis protein
MDKPAPLRHLGFAIIRTPLLPMAQWLAHAAQGHGANAWQRRADSARELFGRAVVSEAICIASPGLYERLQRWDWCVRGAEDRKLLTGFERYLNRMCFRATPFGLFATVSYAPLVAGQGWTLDAAAAAAQPQRAARPDGEALCALADLVQSGPADTSTRYAINASLYRVGDSYRFIDWTTGGDTGRVYQIGEIDRHPLIDALVERMTGRLLRCGEIAALMDDMARAEDIDVAALVGDLAEAKVLLPEIVLDPLNADPAGALAAALARHETHCETGAQLRKFHGMLRESPSDPAPERYLQADEGMRELTGVAPAGLAVQVDAFRKHPLMAVDAADIDAAVATLGWLMDRFSARHGPLDAFCAAFARRYGSGTVPLMEALDPESGIGFNDTAVSDELLVELGIKRPTVTRQLVTPTPLDNILMKRLQRDPGLLAKREVVLTRDDAADLALTREGNAGNGMTAILHFPMLRGEDGRAVRTPLLGGLDKDGTLNWVTRFCHGDERITAAALAHCQQVEDESGPEAVHAEIAYLPKPRAVNVLTRPPLWTWRINLAEPAAEPGEHDLPVSDLLLSVAGNEIRLWSRWLGKRVIPHRTSAHRFDDRFNTAAYRFLCTLGSHGMRVPHLDWGAVFAPLDYLPRLRFDSLVLMPARWRLGEAELKRVGQSPDALRALLEERRIPQRVELTEGDNRLLLDLGDEVDFAQLTRMAKKRRELLLVEVLDDLDGNAAAWRHQLVVPLHRPSPAIPAARPAFQRDLARAPMAEALYVKLYAGQQTLDRRVIPHVADWIARQRQQDAIRNWFFIRYGDPDWHLRLRVFPREGLNGAVMHELIQLAEGLQQHGWISRFEFMPYEREMVRYGGPDHIGANEALFGIDSEVAAAIVSGTPFCACDAPARWQAAVLAIDALLRDYGLGLEQRLKLATRLASSFRHEFALGDRQIGALGDLYRRHGRAMIAALRDAAGAPAWAARLRDLLNGVSSRRQAAAAPLLAADRQLDMAASQVHMLCNRLFIAQNREFEVLVYDFLARAYRALGAMPVEGKR